jgi:hypothetical protein
MERTFLFFFFLFLEKEMSEEKCGKKKKKKKKRGSETTQTGQKPRNRPWEERLETTRLSGNQASRGRRGWNPECLVAA